MLTIARPLMGNLSLVLADEPSQGLAPRMVRMLGEMIRRLTREVVTVLLPEQHVKCVVRVADRAYVIDTGRIRCSGSARALWDDDEIKRRYPAM
jgi:branched-chain amino acid transport system ATP-binding protein